MSDGESTFVLSGFGDEIADDLETQLDGMGGEGLSHLDLRSVGGTNVLDLDDDRVREVDETLDAYGFSVAAIGSPIGKIGIEEDFEAHLDRFRTAIEMAAAFDTEYVRVFSYYIPEDDDAADWRGEVMRRMEAKAEIAEEEDVTLLHENERDIYGDTPGRCRDILTHVDSPNLRAVFDPANFLAVGARPYPDALLDLAEFVEYLHVKDAESGEGGAITPAGEGDADIPAIVEALRRRGFDGVAALEPHLETAGRAGGYSGPEGFRVAARAFTDILDAAGVRYG